MMRILIVPGLGTFWAVLWVNSTQQRWLELGFHLGLAVHQTHALQQIISLPEPWLVDV
jgi:hypothetical protein